MYAGKPSAFILNSFILVHTLIICHPMRLHFYVKFRMHFRFCKLHATFNEQFSRTSTSVSAFNKIFILTILSNNLTIIKINRIKQHIVFKSNSGFRFTFKKLEFRWTQHAHKFVYYGATRESKIQAVVSVLRQDT